MDAATPQPGDLALPLSSQQVTATAGDRQHTGPVSALPQVNIPPQLLEELCRAAQTDALDLSSGEFEQILTTVGSKVNYGIGSPAEATPVQRESFFRALHLPDLALAHACALGREQAWREFLARYRGPLTQAATSITRSASLGQDLADSLYSELFGLSEREGLRRSPLSSYSGRGSLIGWLRTTLAQRHVDHYRRTRHETPLDDQDFPAASAAPQPASASLSKLGGSVATVLQALPPEDRFLLASYYLDQRTLLQIAQILRVHEATVSRKLKRLTASLRQQLLEDMRASGLSRRAAEEALGVDPRDLTINLRAALQTSAASPFSQQGHNSAGQPS